MNYLFHIPGFLFCWLQCLNLTIRSSWSEPVSSQSCFCWLYSASPSLAAKNIINLISVLTSWWCPCVESSLVLLEEAVFQIPYDYTLEVRNRFKGLEFESRKSRDTWSNRQIWPWNTEWSRAKANRVLPREHTGHSKYPVPTTQEKTLHMDIIRWSIQKSDWLYSLQPKMEKLYTVSKNKTQSWLWLRSWTPYCQIQTYVKKVGKTTRPFRYDLNQVPYDYTVEVRLDLRD